MSPNITSAPTLTDLLFEKAEVGLCLVAPDDTVIRANSEWLRSTRFTNEQVVGESIIELFPETRDVALALQARARAGHCVEVPRHALMVNGRETWWEGSIEPVPIEGGTGLLITAREITPERREASIGSGADEERFSPFFHTATIGAAELDLDGRFIAVNDRLCDLTGYSRAELLGLTPADLTHPGDRQFDEPHLSAYLRGELPTYQAEKRYVCKDGAVIWVEVSAAMVRDATGRPLRSAGIIQDITERKRAEGALRESEERFRAAFGASPDAININRLSDGVYVSVNDGFTRMSGWSAAEAIGKTTAELGVWEDRAERDRLMERLLADEAVHGAEARFRRKDGSVLTASISARIFTARGERFLLAITRDVSDLKRAENVLREADRQKNQFLAMLSHELRNPLAPIRNSLFILDRAAPGGERARKAQAILNRQIGQLTWLIDDLLDVTRIAHGKIQLQHGRLDLNEVAHRCVEDHRTVFAKSDVRLEVLPAAAEVWVNGDRVRLAQVVGNLLQNAAKFTPHGGKTTVSVQADPAGGQAVLTVRDTGAGIEPAMSPRLFHVFAQAGATLDRSKGGLGLGLALVKGLIELHGGSVSAASEGPGKGAAFTISLPLDVAVTVARATPVQGGLAGAAAPRRILIIEDNEDAAETLRVVLELHEHVVEIAYSGRDGIEKARAFHPDVVLCDIGLPEMDGYEVARAMRADPALRRVALVAVSGYVQPEDVEMAREAGFDAHLAKPPSIDALERALAEVGSARQDQPAERAPRLPSRT